MIPKFRAWDVESKKMTRWEDLILEKDDRQDYFSIGYKATEILTKFDHEQVLMQSTGLFDKNGQEIFEGDVVKMKYTVLSDYEFFKVTRFRGGSWIIDNQQRGSELWLRNEDCEIIGNIYENPELVEAENE